MTGARAAKLLVALSCAAVFADGRAAHGEGAAMPPNSVGARRTEDAAATVVRLRSARANGGVAILSSGVRAAAVVAGTVSNLTPVDAHAWTATLTIDESIAGSLAPGSTTTIAWEELAESRAVRFNDGERVAVVLDPVPDQTIWTKRLAQPDTHADYVVAERGDAFLRSPDATTTDVLLHWFALAPAARDGAPGAMRLVELADSGNGAVATEALELLGARKNLADQLGDSGGKQLLHVAQSERHELPQRTRALEIATARGLRGVKETALALAETPSPMRAPALHALASLPSGLTAERKRALLDDKDPEARKVGVEASDASSRARILEMARGDASPVVRLAAARVLVTSDGAAAIADVAPLLEDGDTKVRLGVARALGELGTSAVEPLRRVIDIGSEKAAMAAAAGLSVAGRDGRAELALIARVHPNEKLRTVAKLALGKAPDSDPHGVEP